MDNLDLKIQTILNSSNLKVSRKYVNTINSTLKDLPPIKRNVPLNLKLSFATICCSIILITGIAFASEIEEFIVSVFNDFGLGEGVSVAVDNGYIGISNMDNDFQNVKILENDYAIDNIDVKMSINKFIITDDNLSLDMNLEYENKLNNYVKIIRTEEGNISYEESYGIEIEDLLILDEDNNIIYSNLEDKESFENLCKKNNLKISYPEQNVYNVHYLVKVYNENETNYSNVEFISNLSSSSGFSNPKKLNIYFTKIKLFNDCLKSGVTDEIMLMGNFKFNLDVPKIMYNRNSDSYQVTSSTNQDFNVYETKLTDTKFEIGIEISNIKEPEYPNVLSQIETEIAEKNKVNGKSGYDFSFESREDIVKFYGSEELANLWEEYYKKYYIVGDTLNLLMPWIKEDRTCYVEDSLGKKYRLKPLSLDSFIENNKYDYRATCEMNKYTATDDISITIMFDGKPVKINLSK